MARFPVVFVFFLVGICNMTFVFETMVLPTVATVVQCFWHAGNRLRFINFAFNLPNWRGDNCFLMITYPCSAMVFRSKAPLPCWLPPSSLPVQPHSGRMRSVPGKHIDIENGKKVFWTVPYYLSGAGHSRVIQFATASLVGRCHFRAAGVFFM